VSFARRFLASLALLAPAVLPLAPRVGSAQAVAGVGDDAIPLPARGWRIGVRGEWDQWDRRLSADGRTPLLAPFASPALGADRLPALRPAQDALQTMLGGSYALSLGALEATGGVRRASSILQAEFGITSRFSLGVRVPYVEVVHDAQLALNPDGTGANVGRNPARLDAQAGINNGGVYVALSNAGSALSSALSTCTANPTGDGCDVVLADPAAAQALIARAAAFAAAWRTVYGDGEQAGAPVVPHVASDAHAQLDAALASLSADFARFGNATVPSAIPNGATSLYGTAGLQALAQDSAFGVNADTLDRALRAGMGDVELEVRALLFDTWRGSQAARLGTVGSGVRVMAAAGWRFGTASSAQAEQAFALATGDGVNALLLRTSADLVWRRWAWVSFTARATLPQADRAVVRFPDVGLPEGFFASRSTAVSRELGRRVDLEVTPRVSLGDNIGLAASLVHRTLASDRYLADGGETWSSPSGSAQFATLGVTYSTLAPYVRGRSKLALEVSFMHEVALGASGVAVPSLVRDRIELRVYPRFPRR
jgi:hypothetical protein